MNRTKILQALNASYPFRLSSETLLAAVRIDGDPVSDADFDADIQALSAKGFVEISRSEIDAAKLLFKIEKSGIRWLEQRRLAEGGI